MDEKELTMERIFDAPRELVYKAWTDPELVKKWWGPEGVTNKVDEWNATPGGKIDLTMIAGDELGPLSGQEWPMGGEFVELEEPSKIIFNANAIIDGKDILEHRTTVTFSEEEGKTKMTVHVKVTKAIMPEASMPLQGMEQGWNQQLDKLVEYLKQT